MLFAIEGIDASGKQTQADLLARRFRRHGLKSALLSFPRYAHTHFGACIGEYLEGKLGRPDELPPKLISMLYAGDRFESLTLIRSMQHTNDAVVFDRYVASNLAYQAAKVEPADRDSMLQWIERMEYDVFGLPRPEVNIFLDVPVATAAMLMLEKRSRSYTDKRLDVHEEDLEYLNRCREAYLEMIRQQRGGDWLAIPCVDGAGRMLDRDVITERIWESLNSHIAMPPPGAAGVGSRK